MKTPLSTHRRTRAQAGFTLTEILVAMAIALIGAVMMFQIMESADTQKRTTGAGSDAQTAGAIAMYALERDLRPAGNGFGGLPAASLNCTVSAYDAVRGSSFDFPLVPVLINDGASGAPDQVISLYGNADVAALTLSFNASTTTSKSMDSNSGSARGGLMPGDTLLVVNGASCGLIEITDNSNGDARTIDHAQGSYVRHYPAVQAGMVSDSDYQYAAGSSAPTTSPTARYNAPSGYNLANGTLYSLGRRDLPRRNIWQISNGGLTVTDDFHNGPALNVGEGIVDLQAQYGLSTTTPPTWQSTQPADWSKVIAIRVALLARSQQYEKTNVTTIAPAWNGGSFVMNNVDGTTDSGASVNSPNNWRHYRYRVYETSIPLRNRLWGGP